MENVTLFSIFMFENLSNVWYIKGPFEPFTTCIFVTRIWDFMEFQPPKSANHLKVLNLFPHISWNVFESNLLAHFTF